MAIESIVDKVSNQMESVTSTSYPYNAIEEAVVNAFYHRDYSKYEPVTIEIEPECIRIINCPGIDRSVSDAAIREGRRFRSRYYRNRRLGEFLHELELCEGHCTGIPTIQEELERNGSPAATFETDADRQSVCVTIPVHPRFLEKEADKHIGTENEKTDIEQQKTGIETQVRSIISTEIKNGAEDGAETVLISGRSKAAVSMRIEAVFEELQKNNAATADEMALQLGITRRQVQAVIKKLKDSGRIYREGSDRDGMWKMT